MNKIAALLLIAIPFFANGQQKISWGLKAGVQSAQLRGEDFRGFPGGNGGATVDLVRAKGGATIGYAIGGYVRTTEEFFLQGEFMLSLKGAELTRLSSGTKQAIKYGQIDLPLSVGYRYGQFEIIGGPLISVQVYDDGNLKNFLGQFSNSALPFSPYSTYNVGYQAGVGVHFGKLSANLRYMASIKNVSELNIAYTTADGQKRDSRFQQHASIVQLTLGYQIK